MGASSRGQGSGTTGDSGSSFLVVKIRDKISDPDRQALLHRYEFEEADEPTNPFEPHGFTGRVDTFLETSFGVRYVCNRQ